MIKLKYKNITFSIGFTNDEYYTLTKINDLIEDKLLLDDVNENVGECTIFQVDFQSLHFLYENHIYEAKIYINSNYKHYVRYSFNTGFYSQLNINRDECSFKEWHNKIINRQKTMIL